MAKLFLTGASGYVGGQALYSISRALPELSIRALVRDATKAQTVKAAFPKVQTIEGSLDDAALVSREAGDADIILNLADAKHLKSVQAIHEALKKRAADRKAAHWINITGATVLAAAELADSSRVPGSPSDITFDDLDGTADIEAVIKKHPFREVDNYILNVAAEASNIRTAHVVGPIIYGKGQGPVGQRSYQIPAIAKATLQRRRGLQVGSGQNRWGLVHVADLADLFVKLVETALQGESKHNDQLWNRNGIYITSVGERSFGDLSARVAADAAKKGLIPNDEVDEIVGDEANKLLPAGHVLFGTNARGIGRRGKELLGWVPKHDDKAEEEEIGRAVDEEAKALGLV